MLFAGYKIPHPLENKFILRIQTSCDSSPQEAFKRAITDSISEISLIEERFKVRLIKWQENYNILIVIGYICYIYRFKIVYVLNLVAREL